MTSLYALEGLNFFTADVQAGVGPFLGVFLQAQGWHPDAIGTVMTLGGIAGVLATSPAGALVDATRHKRAVLIVAGVLTVLASLVLWAARTYWMVAASQILTAVTGAALGPALAGVTLGIVHEQGFVRQFGRNQVANHASNVVGAALSGWLGWRYGFGAVFALAGGCGALSIVATLLIPADSIDHDKARGLTASSSMQVPAQSSGFRVLLISRPLLLLSAALAIFPIDNAAMLPLYGLAVVAAHKGDPSPFTAQTIVVAQLVMVVAACFANRLIQRFGYWGAILITFLALPLRGLVAAIFITGWGVWPAQALDGIGARLQSVAVPALVVRLSQGTGRVNIRQSVLMTVQGIGAALSPALGGMLAQHFGYATAFRPSAEPTPTHFASIDDPSAVPFLKDHGREGYEKFLMMGRPRAFAVAPDGGWDAATLGPDPVAYALNACGRVHLSCRLYAVNGDVVWSETAKISVESLGRTVGK